MVLSKCEEYSWIATFGLSVGLSELSISVLETFYPSYVVNRKISSVYTGLVISTVFIPQLILSYLSHSIIKKFGSLTVYRFGIVLTGVASVAFGMTDRISDNSAFLASCFGLKLLQGTGMSFIYVTCVSLASDHLPHRLGIMLGVIESCTSIGYIIGPVVGGPLFDVIGYEWTMTVSGAVVLVPPFISLFTIKQSQITNSYLQIQDESSTSTCQSPERNLLKFLIIPEVILLMVADTFAFFINAGYALLIPIYSRYTVQLSVTDIGLILMMISAIYGVTCLLIGCLIDRTKHNHIIVKLGTALGCVLLLTIGVLEQLKLISFVGFAIISCAIPIAASLIGLPVMNVLQQIARKHSYEESESLSILLSNIIVNCLMLGAFLGTGSAGIIFEKIGIGTSSLILAAMFFIVFVGQVVKIKFPIEEEEKLLRSNSSKQLLD